jgi:branched-chain amino acid transport system permease protein
MVRRRLLKFAIFLCLAFLFLIVFPSVCKSFYVYTLSSILLTGLLATSLNFALGYGGMYQFHHAVFYGVSAYGIALMLMKVHAPFVFAFLFGPLLSAFLGLFMGWICLRLAKLYFGMLQLSLGSIVWIIIRRWASLTGGDDGIHGIQIPDFLSSYTSGYYFTLIVTSISLLILYKIVHSPFGKVLQSIRDNPLRSEMVGINQKRHQLFALVIAAFFGGVAGSLFVVIDRTVFPDIMFFTYSFEILVMCLLGGLWNFLGPLVGSAVIICLRVLFSAFTVYWTLLVGLLMLLVIFFVPNGILGYLEDKLRKRAYVQGGEPFKIF